MVKSIAICVNYDIWTFVCIFLFSSETIHGRKHWVLYPPANRPSYNLDYASRHWMEYTYPSLKNWTTTDDEHEHHNHEEYLQQRKRRSLNSSSDRKKAESNSVDESESPSTKKPWECTINAGEMIYFPDQWHHATINLSPYTVFVSSFTSEHENWAQDRKKQASSSRMNTIS